MFHAIEKLRPPFQSGKPNSVAKRKDLLRSLYKMLTEHEEEFLEAVKLDLGKCKLEALECEIMTSKMEIAYILRNIDNWTADITLPRTFFSMMDNCRIQRQPYGLVLILCPWNYPLQLALTPLAGAIAAGNAVVLKPSELAPATEKILVSLLPKYLDEDIACVITGGANETIELLEKQKFDFIFYTGGSKAARSVMSQAAKNLTPVAFELGGKCPVYLDNSVNMAVAVKRIVWAKYLNAGQTCVAPDYILCHKNIFGTFINACKKTLMDFYGENVRQSADYSRIINSNHMERLCGILKRTKGKIEIGGTYDVSEKFMEPTVVTNIQKDDALMEDEIFGPILPIMTVDSSDEAILYVNSREKPLAAYVYSTNKNIQKQWLENTTSGSLTFNESIFQLAVPNLPFGGVGNSGMGRYHGEASINLFSNSRSICDKSTFEKANNLFRYPPYNNENMEPWVRRIFSTPEDSTTTCSIS